MKKIHTGLKARIQMRALDFPQMVFNCCTRRHLHWFLMLKDIKIIISIGKHINGSQEK